ncbi:outer membrane beta-barrel protein [Fibrella forsythiae]|nr:outer membrane beta-barrel protein [Fibrella forsythiae]
MNKVLLAVGLLSAGMAVGQSQTTKSTSTTTSTSNYNTSNTNNENSRNATMGTNSSTDRPYSTTGSSYNSNGSTSGMGRTGSSTGSYSNSSTTGSNSYNNSGMNTGMSTGSYSSTTTPGTYNNSTSGYGTSTTTPSTNGSYNTNSMDNSSTTTPSTTGSYNTNSVGTGTSATTPTTSDYNTTGTSVTTNSTYSTETTSPARTKDYKNFAYGIYAGLNSTRFRGESINTDNPSGRIGYQAGFFVRGGGRLYGQIGAEYFASSSNYFRPGDGQSAAAIRDQINIQYIQIPVYIGFKLTESDRGISAIRLQVGAEYANRISSSSGQFNLSNSEIKSGSFNALGQLGFDIGPFLIDLTYHHGLSDAVQINTFQGSSRRILSASVGFKF